MGKSEGGGPVIRPDTANIGVSGHGRATIDGSGYHAAHCSLYRDRCAWQRRRPHRRPQGRKCEGAVSFGPFPEIDRREDMANGMQAPKPMSPFVVCARLYGCCRRWQKVHFPSTNAPRHDVCSQYEKIAWSPRSKSWWRQIKRREDDMRGQSPRRM